MPYQMYIYTIIHHFHTEDRGGSRISEGGQDIWDRLLWFEANSVKWLYVSYGLMLGRSIEISTQ